MNIFHDFHDNNPLDICLLRGNILYQAVARLDRTLHTVGAGSRREAKETTMHAHGHTTLWGTRLGVGQTTYDRSWYQQVKAWWTAHRIAREESKLATLRGYWDARREAVRPMYTHAISDMVTSTHRSSVTTALCDLSV